MNNASDEHQIRETINYYSEGMRKADVDTLRKAFHEQAILCGYLGDDLIAAPIEGLYEWVGANPAPETYNCTVLDITLTNRVAVASVRESDPHGVVIDHFHLLKVGDSWSIVSKIWDTEPDNS